MLVGLKEGLHTKWTYKVDDDIITINYTNLRPTDILKWQLVAALWRKK